MNKKPIGVFDSGIGGLTVVKEIIKQLPNESIIYLGDTARVPYGTRDKDTVRRFSLEIANFLLKQDIKILIVACNTISSVCLDDIKQISPVGVLGAIKPAANKIVQATKTKKVGIIGTNATIKSEVYEKEIHLIDPTIKIFSKSAPLFVPIAEEGLGNTEIAKLAAEYYLDNIRDIDTLHLGCTHYPLLKSVIQDTIGESVKIIDSAEPIADELVKQLRKDNLTSLKGQPKYRFLFTDIAENLTTVAENFLGRDITSDLDKIRLI